MCGLAGCVGTRDRKTVNKMLDALHLVINEGHDD